MDKTPTPADERRLLRLIAGVNISEEPITPRLKDGRYIRSMDQDVMRDLRGIQFEREVRDAFDRATSTRLRATAADRTAVDEGDAMGMLMHVAVAEMGSQLGPDQAAEALLRIGRELRRYGNEDLRETILNLVDEAVHHYY